MGAGHDHGLDNLQHERPLWWALGLTAAFVVVEVVVVVGSVVVVEVVLFVVNGGGIAASGLEAMSPRISVPSPAFTRVVTPSTTE